MESVIINGQSPVTVSAESVGTGDGSTVTFTATLASLVVAPSSLSVVDGVETFTDNGDGTLSGSAGGTGTINYRTGALSVTFNTAPTTGASITASYNQLATSERVPNAVYPSTIRFRADSADVDLLILESEDGTNWVQAFKGEVKAHGVETCGVITSEFLDVRASASGRLEASPANPT